MPEPRSKATSRREAPAGSTSDWRGWFEPLRPDLTGRGVTRLAGRVTIAALVIAIMAALADCGHWVSLGQATGMLEPLAADWLGAKSIIFSRPVVFHYVATQEKLAERAARVWTALAEGVFSPLAIERFTLAAAGRAHERLPPDGRLAGHRRRQPLGPGAAGCGWPR